jgi:hypothetical protein
MEYLRHPSGIYLLSLKHQARFAKARPNGFSNKTIPLHEKAPTKPNAIESKEAREDLAGDIEKSVKQFAKNSRVVLQKNVKPPFLFRGHVSRPCLSSKNLR